MGVTAEIRADYFAEALKAAARRLNSTICTCDVPRMTITEIEHDAGCAFAIAVRDLVQAARLYARQEQKVKNSPIEKQITQKVCDACQGVVSFAGCKACGTYRGKKRDQ